MSVQEHRELSPAVSYLGNMLGGASVFLGAAAFVFYVIVPWMSGSPHLPHPVTCPPPALEAPEKP